MKKLKYFIFGLMVGAILSGSTVYAFSLALWVNGQNQIMGTTSNPVVIQTN